MSQLTAQQRELVAIGASLASNCIPCIKFHVRQGREAGLTDEMIEEAIDLADAVRRVPARMVRDAAAAALGRDRARAPNAGEKPACGGVNDSPESVGMAGSPCCGPGVDP